MAKISVVDAADKLKQDPSVFLVRLKDLGIFVDDMQSMIDTGILPRVRTLLKKEKEKEGGGYSERRLGKTVIRRRVSKRAAAPVETPEPEPETPVSEKVDRQPKKKISTESPEASKSIGDVLGRKRVTKLQPLDEVERLEDLQEEDVVELPEVVDSAETPSTDIVDEATTDEESEKDADAVAEPLPESTPSGEEAEPEAVVEPVFEATEKTEEKEQSDADKNKAKSRRQTRMRKIRGVTAEPARVISRPATPVAPTTPPGPKKDAAKTEDDKDKPERKGRRVIEISRSQGYGSRRRTKEQQQRELRVERHRKKKSSDLKSTEITTPKAIKRKIKIEGAIKVGELARRIGIKSSELIKKLFAMGQGVTINQSLDIDSATIIAAEYDYEIEDITVEVESFFNTEQEDEGNLKPRHPVVTVMGHVDHGKTSLLDAIRSTSVVTGEAGGITQHIGAYKVDVGGKSIAFIDTPGHESFTLMRARGAHVTDIVILVVAADDGVMPQTAEAINHARDAKVPIVVAINKIDKGEDKLKKIYAELAEFGLLQESWGGDTQFALVSAKQGTGVQDLLEKVLLQAEIMELKANSDKKASGVVLEARLEKGRGPVATILVSEGTLCVGDPIVSGIFHGRVRFMHDSSGERVYEAKPADPVEVVGLGGVAEAGDRFFVAENEKKAKQAAEIMMNKAREARTQRMGKVSLENLFDQIKEDGVKELKLVLKGDVQGSVEAVKDALHKLTTEMVKVTVAHSGVGAITEGDINFAVASEALVIGFNVRPSPEVRDLAGREGVQIKVYSIIYELLDDIRGAMTGLLAPVFTEVYQGRAEVRNIFSVSRIGKIAGSYVTDGKVMRDSHVRLLRDSVEVYNGRLASLKRFKDDAKEVASGYECGMQIANFNDIHIGDILECYSILESAGVLGEATSA